MYDDHKQRYYDNVLEEILAKKEAERKSNTQKILDKYQKIEQIMSERPIDMIRSNPTLNAIWKVVKDKDDN